jgi:hypothetical protein
MLICEIASNYPDDRESSATSPLADPVTWDLLRQFASSDTMTLPQTEEKLSTHLGDRYVAKDWYPALKAVMDAEGDVIKAQKALREIFLACEHPKLTIKVPARSACPMQLANAEEAIIGLVQRLKDRNRLFGEIPTIDDIIDPVDEQEDVEESPYAFPDGETGIIKQVIHEEKVKRGEIIEIEDDEDDEDDEPLPDASRHETITLIAQLELLAVKFGSPKYNTTALSHSLQNSRAYLHREDLLHGKQSHIDSFFTKK